MELYPWEEKAYKELTKLYNEFFDKLASLGKECYRIDAHKIFPSNAKDLTVLQEKKIRDYWNQFVEANDFDINYHKYYIDRTGIFDERYIPDDIYAGYIDGYLNNRAIEPGISDKNYFDMFLKGLKMPKTIVHLINGFYEDPTYTIISEDDAISILANYDRFIVKPSMSSYGGKGVKIFEKPSSEEIRRYLHECKTDNLIFQEIVNQNNVTAILHPQSLNTIRIMTLLIDDDVKVLPASFRMGVGDSIVDNASNGGIYCKIQQDGCLSSYAYNAEGRRFNRHPDGGDFSQIKFTFMDKIYQTVILAAQRFPHFRLIGWDIAVDENEDPVIIEANLTMSSLDVIETICGPLFGDLTDQVLKEVFTNNKQKPGMDILQFI